MGGDTLSLLPSVTRKALTEAWGGEGGGGQRLKRANAGQRVKLFLTFRPATSEILLENNNHLQNQLHNLMGCLVKVYSKQSLPENNQKTFCFLLFSKCT